MNMLRRSVGRAVRSRIVSYVALYAVLLALHLQFTLGTGDDPMYAAMLDQYSLAYFSLWHYYTWSARTLIEAVVCIVEALPAIVWRLADPLCITLCAACIVRLARLEDRPAGRWAVCGLALCYPWQDMSSAGWVCTTLVFVWPLLAALAALLPLGESLRGNRTRAWQCAAALPLTLYAANMELLAGLLTLLLLAYLAWCLWAHRRPHWLAWAQLGLCAANIVYALTCPGTALRYGNEVTSWFQDYGMRSLWQNFELGISAAMSRMVLEPHLLFFVFCVLLACAVWARYRQPLYRLFSLFPVSAALVLGVLGGPLRALAPRLSFFADAVTEKGDAHTAQRVDAETLAAVFTVVRCAVRLRAGAVPGAGAWGGGLRGRCGLSVGVRVLRRHGLFAVHLGVGRAFGFLLCLRFGGRGRAGAARAAGETDAVAGVRLYGSRVRAGAMSLAPRGIGLFLGGGTTDF